MTIRAIACAVCLLVTLRSGTDGIRAVGWFGDDWSIDKGDFIWNDGRRFP